MRELKEDVWYQECDTCEGDALTFAGVCRDCDGLGYVEHDQESHMVKDKVTYLLRNDKFMLNMIEAGPETAATIERTEYSQPSAAKRMPNNSGIKLNWTELKFNFVQSDN